MSGKIPSGIKNSAYKRWGRKCRCCHRKGTNKNMMTLHHLNGVHEDNRISNLMPLCENCHQLFEHLLYLRIGKYKELRGCKSCSGESKEVKSSRQT